MSKKIAITGGIGSGKSTVCDILREMGYPVYSCDKIYAEIASSQAYIDEIEKRFPVAVKQGVIDKKTLADIIFSDEEKRAQLNAIAHPLVIKTLIKRMNEEKNAIVFAEVPLLLEGGFENLFDFSIIVMRDREARIRSVCERDNVSREKAIKRLNAQFNYDDANAKKRLQKINAVIIENKEDISTLKKSVQCILKGLV